MGREQTALPREHPGCEPPLVLTCIHWLSLHLALAGGLCADCNDVAGGDKVGERSDKMGVLTPRCCSGFQLALSVLYDLSAGLIGTHP